jgi:pyruvate dehydrogenase E1 component alpha subunit
VTGGGSATARARGFGLPAEEVDGQDVLAVHRAVSAAAARARRGAGPSFLEMRTYRYRGHNTGEIIRYRTEEEVAGWRSTRDPIDRLAAHLEAAGVLTPDELAALAKAQFAEVDAAVRFADESPWPDPGTARLHVTGLADAAQGGGR